jgi:hypothetical protein
VATPETEARVLAVGRVGTAHHVERIVRGWRRVDRLAEAREAACQHAGRALHVYHDQDGTVALRGRLHSFSGQLSTTYNACLLMPTELGGEMVTWSRSTPSALLCVYLHEDRRWTRSGG